MLWEYFLLDGCVFKVHIFMSPSGRDTFVAKLMLQPFEVSLHNGQVVLKCTHNWPTM